MGIVQNFYDSLASQYHKLFENWQAESKEQGDFLSRLFQENGFDKRATVLDCASGIGTQAISLALLGYNVTASDISEAELAQAKAKAWEAGVEIDLRKADFRYLSDVFEEQFDIIIAMDNALPHMLSKEDLKAAVVSITGRIKDNGIFVGSIRDYDALLLERPPYSPPYIHKQADGQRVSFQTWDWSGERYKLTQYIIDDGEKLEISKFECEYRATKREELTKLFAENGCKSVSWLEPEKSGFYQPVVVVRK